jgi:hypothetical protein
VKRVLVVLTAAAMVLALSPAAGAATGTPTNPSASVATVYPYVSGGRVDTTEIAFAMDDPSVLSYELQVYPFGTTSFNASERLLQKDIGSTGSTVWDPASMGNVLGNGTTGPNGTTFMACVYPAGEHLEATDVFYDWCVDVNVVHYRSDRDLTKQRWGRAFDSKRGRCATKRLRHAVLIRCHKRTTAKLTYVFKKPPLTNDEKSFVGVASVNWRGRVFRLGDGISLSRTGPGALVVASKRFLGKVHWIRKTWTIRTEF